MKAQLLFTTVSAILSAQGILAFPGLATRGPGALIEALQKLETRQNGIGNLTTAQLGTLVLCVFNGTCPGVSLPAIKLPGVLNPITIELPPVVAAGRKIIPDAAHPFQAPGPGDQRGGCPGLNIMANYGYISRNGITSASEIIWGTQEMLGCGIDVSLLLVGLSLLACMDPTNLKMSIGTTDPRTNSAASSLFGTVNGCFDKSSHNAFEVDGSVAYLDSALSSDGNTGHFSSSMWSEAAAVAAQTSGGLFDNDWVAELRYKRYQECVAQNPNCYWGPKQVAFYAGDGFSFTIMPSAGPDGNPLPPTTDVASRFWGASTTPNGTYAHVPERLTPSPDGHWYRRSLPLFFPQQAQYAVEAYLKHPVLFGGNQGKVNSFLPIPDQIGNALTSSYFCTVFNVYQENIPPPYASIRDGLIALTNIFLAPARLAIGCP